MAIVKTTPSYRLAIAQIQEFLLMQDPASAARRFAQFKKEENLFRKQAEHFPRMSRPYHPPTGPSTPEEQEDCDWIEALRKAEKLPELRERVLQDYVILYAASADVIALISVRHQRASRYRPTDL
jgi:hypothetical protein